MKKRRLTPWSDTVKIFFALFLLCPFCQLKAQEADGDDALLFEISGNGLQKSSYLLGTDHNVDGRFVHEIPCFDSILQKVDAVAAEYDIDSMYHIESIKEWLALEYKIDSIRIDSTLYDETLSQYTHTIDTVLAKCGKSKDFKSRHPYTNLAIVKWYATTYACNEEDFKSGKITPKEFLQMDRYITRLAKEQHKTLIHLDSIAMFVNFGESDLKAAKQKLYEVPIEEQMMELYYTSRSIYKSYNLNKERTAYYKAGEWWRAQNLEYNLFGYRPDNNNVRGRNRRWMNQIPSIMAKHPTLIAVGIGHLFHRKFSNQECNGLIADLRKQGYTVKAVK